MVYASREIEPSRVVWLDGAGTLLLCPAELDGGEGEAGGEGGEAGFCSILDRNTLEVSCRHGMIIAILQWNSYSCVMVPCCYMYRNL